MKISDNPFKSQDFGLPDNAFVYCCFNEPIKIDPLIFETWMKILHKTPDSVLWLSKGQEPAVKNLRQAAIDHGINSERLIFAERLPHSQFLKRNQLADLFLDTYYYNAGATAVAAASSGIPILTCPHDSFTSRMGASICAALELKQMICKDLEEYENKAVDFYYNPDKLKVIKETLINNHDSLPLFNTKQFIKNLENLLIQMYSIYNDGQKPRSIKIDEIKF